MAPNPECFRFGHGQKNVLKIARKALANLDVDLASQALGQTGSRQGVGTVHASSNIAASL